MVKLLSVAVSAKVKAMLRPVVVVMVLPPLYADCRENTAPEQTTTLFDESKQRVLPLSVCNPFKITVESASEVKVTSLASEGVKLEAPLALKVLDAVRVPV